MNKLEKALRSFADMGELTRQLAFVLIAASERGVIGYEDVEKLCQKNTEDVLLLGWKWRLLIPVRTSRSGEWDHRMLMFELGEVYELPNVVRFLVKEAERTGEWNPTHAVAEVFKTMRETAWKQIPDLVERLGQRASNYAINAYEIKEACREMGLEDRVDTLIAILKGSGVMSPKLGLLSEVVRTGTPIYEVNPCLFVKP